MSIHLLQQTGPPSRFSEFSCSAGGPAAERGRYASPVTVCEGTKHALDNPVRDIHDQRWLGVA